MDQTIVSKIESGARRVTLDDALALALALDVSPVSLYLPHGENERVRLAPGRVEDAATAWAWATEREPLPDMHAETFYAEQSETAQMTEARAALVRRLVHETGDE